MSVFMIGILTIVILSTIFISTMYQMYLTEKKKELYRQANTIAISLVTTGYFDEEKDKSYLATMQASVGGRGFIVDQNSNILFDTNHLDEGKMYANQQVIEGLRGRSSYYFLDEKNMGMVTVPIMDRDYQTVLGVVIISEVFSDIEESLVYLINVTLLVALGLVIILTILSYYFSSNLTRPFRSFIEHMNRITQGHGEERVDIHGNKEIEEISTAFNVMINRLEDIESNRQQFVANVSHELKTPLSSIKVLAESLLHQPNSPIEIYQEFLQDINAEVDRENKIINDLLTLVTLDRNENILRIREVVINEMIEGVLKRLKPLADQKNIEMLFESYRVIIAEIDEMKLDLALTNLIENAIKYNKEYGYINVILDTDFKDFIISVKDTGEGIPEENLDQIFRRFYRVDKTRSRETGGTGLGLSIVQKAVHMHKGSIRCKSELGQWSEFIVKIPLKQGNIPEVNTNEKMEE